MAEEITKNDCCKERKPVNYGNTPGAVYGLGFIGAVIYFIQNADTFGMGVLGVLKAIVWPAIVIYKVLEWLKM
ncbi:MAG: hypothetical protein WC107_01030 [Patescibacteria group bacterium]